MTVEEGIVLLRDGLLELHNDQYLPNVEASCDDLQSHDREVNFVTMSQEIINGHVSVERVLEALIERG